MQSIGIGTKPIVSLSPSLGLLSKRIVLHLRALCATASTVELLSCRLQKTSAELICLDGSLATIAGLF